MTRLGFESSSKGCFYLWCKNKICYDAVHYDTTWYNSFLWPLHDFFHVVLHGLVHLQPASAEALLSVRPPRRRKFARPTAANSNEPERGSCNRTGTPDVAPASESVKCNEMHHCAKCSWILMNIVQQFETNTGMRTCECFRTGFYCSVPIGLPNSVQTIRDIAGTSCCRDKKSSDTAAMAATLQCDFQKVLKLRFLWKTADAISEPA
jgi:hypothetical protein